MLFIVVVRPHPDDTEHLAGVLPRLEQVHITPELAHADLPGDQPLPVPPLGEPVDVIDAAE